MNTDEPPIEQATAKNPPSLDGENDNNDNNNSDNNTNNNNNDNNAHENNNNSNNNNNNRNGDGQELCGEVLDSETSAQISLRKDPQNEKNTSQVAGQSLGGRSGQSSSEVRAVVNDTRYTKKNEMNRSSGIDTTLQKHDESSAVSKFFKALFCCLNEENDNSHNNRQGELPLTSINNRRLESERRFHQHENKKNTDGIVHDVRRTDSVKEPSNSASSLQYIDGQETSHARKYSDLHRKVNDKLVLQDDEETEKDVQKKAKVGVTENEEVGREEEEEKKKEEEVVEEEAREGDRQEGSRRGKEDNNADLEQLEKPEGDQKEDLLSPLGHNNYQQGYDKDKIIDEEGSAGSASYLAPANSSDVGWLLAPVSKDFADRKCLVLDLDETLVHSSFKYIRQADFVIPVEIDSQFHNVYVIKRPGVDEFMKRVGQLFEVVIFTASVSKYGDPLLDQLDIHHVVHHRLFRESCYNHNGNYIKNLSQLGRPLKDVIIIDNSPASYILHPQHAVPVSSWFSDIHDNELLDMIPFLEDLAGNNVKDVSVILDVSI